jgi:predicted site-specific integrase-resolvase
MSAVLPQKMPRLVPIAEWAKIVFGDHAPCGNTLRRWTHEGRISPQPKRVGNNYFVPPSAEYQGD